MAPRAIFYNLAPGLNAPTNTTPTTMANLVAQGIYIRSIDDVTAGFNLSTKPTVMNAVDKRIATVAGSHEITDQITLKSDFLYGYTETSYQLNPQPVTATELSAPHLCAGLCFSDYGHDPHDPQSLHRWTRTASTITRPIFIG